jgi:hypothetical protein
MVYNTISTEPRGVELNIRTLTTIKLCHKVTLNLPKMEKFPQKKQEDKLKSPLFYTKVTPLIHPPLHISKQPSIRRKIRAV